MPNLYKHQGYSLCVLKDFRMVELGFLSQNFGNLVGTHERHLPFSECRWEHGATQKWWGGEDTLTLHLAIDLVALKHGVDKNDFPVSHMFIAFLFVIHTIYLVTNYCMCYQNTYFPGFPTWENNTKTTSGKNLHNFTARKYLSFWKIWILFWKMMFLLQQRQW